MKPTHITRRLALAAALGGAALASTPALANAASTCTYSPNAFPEARVDVFDGSGSLSLTVGRQGPFIRVTDSGIPQGGTVTSTSTLCPGPAGTLGSIFNTDQIVVHGTASSTEELPFILDAGALAPGKTPEPDGNSEIETLVTNNGVPPQLLDVQGTGAADTMRVSANSGVMLGPDNDVDIRVREGAQTIRLEGEGGPDFLSGRGGFPNSSPAPATTRVELRGGGDVSDTSANTLVDGPLPFDRLTGAEGNDTLFSADGQRDIVEGGLGFDTGTVDAADLTISVEQLTTVVGRLKLNPTTIKARAGRPAKITLAWQHPKSWKQLRSLQLTANDAGNMIGSIQVDPARGRISGHGAVQVARGSTVTHHGKWVTARIWLRPSQRLAGRILRLAVQATDVHGHQQLEPTAGTLTVAK